MVWVEEEIEMTMKKKKSKQQTNYKQNILYFRFSLSVNWKGGQLTQCS
jgi:hypothetical protein